MDTLAAQAALRASFQDALDSTLSPVSGAAWESVVHLADIQSEPQARSFWIGVLARADKADGAALMAAVEVAAESAAALLEGIPGYLPVYRSPSIPTAEHDFESSLERVVWQARGFLLPAGALN